MRREFIGAEDLMSKLREHGVDDLAQVKRAVMESNGEVSVVRFDGAGTTAPERSTAPTP
jgi:uncharacterized membrane protein YcaP (DUF421 family)